MVDYTARVKDTNEVFETTREEEAKKNAELHDPTRKYEPRLVSVGESWVLKGLDEALANANVGDKLNVEVTPDKGFGERDPNKVRMIPQRKLGDKADEVSAGDVIEVDERTGIVRYVGSGRIQVDFNHRFAGRTLVYDVNVIKKLDSDSDKVTALVKRRMGVDDSKVKFNLAAPNLEIDIPEEA
ncbi:MAG TPA: FKBP-type peptidyl-prolyl cis-trans isomerase, partial [Nitrososphaera sp.]|nr:FKBP-type peptidyl-prolyl cis-trans isomerase [Nitrososphaera sp.]